MNVWDILILLAVAALAGFAVRTLLRDRKRGCGCGCEGCPSAGSCQKRREAVKKE